MDIEDIKTCFRTLSSLGITEVRVPYNGYLHIIRAMKDHADNGGFWHMREVLNKPPCYSFYGVGILCEDIYWTEY